MENNMLSVIIPAFNTEEYIERCISSVRSQTYGNLEIIIIDDGSTDITGQLMEHFAAKDERIRVLHKQNEGLVAARKSGLQVAQGEYVTFVDSDDWINAEMYELMMDKMIGFDVDLVTSGLVYEYPDGRKWNEIDIVQEGTYLKEQIKEQVLYRMMYDFENSRRGITPSVVNKIFVKSRLLPVVENVNNLISYGEDAAITYPYITQAKKIMVLGDSWYHYYIRDRSLASSFDTGAFYKIKLFYEYMKDFFIENGIYDIMQFQLESYIHALTSYAEYSLLNLSREDTRFIFPYEDIPKGADIILYGAGNVGRCYYRSLKVGNYVNIVAWVDKDYKRISKAGFPIESIEAIKNYIFDYIVIGIDEEETAEAVKQSLIWKMDVPENKIVKGKNKWK